MQVVKLAAVILFLGTVVAIGLAEQKLEENPVLEDVATPTPYVGIHRYRGRNHHHRHHPSQTIIRQDEEHVREDVHLIVDNVCKNVTQAEILSDEQSLCRKDILGKFSASIDTLLAAHNIDRELVEQFGFDCFNLWRVNGHDYTKLLHTILHAVEPEN